MTPHAPLTVAADSDATEKVGEKLSHALIPGDVVLLEGPLAAGKTTLVRGIVRGLEGDTADVSSPTFVIAQTYPCRGTIQSVHHIDLYRLPENPAAVREIGIEDFLADDDAIVAIEWPRELVAEWLPPRCRVWRIVLRHTEDGARRIEVSAPKGSGPTD